MDNKLIEHSEEIRESWSLTLAVQRETEQIKRSADVAEKKADAAQKKADAAWELVVMTREQINRPLWKRWLG